MNTILVDNLLLERFWALHKAGGTIEIDLELSEVYIYTITDHVRLMIDMSCWYVDLKKSVVMDVHFFYFPSKAAEWIYLQDG